MMKTKTLFIAAIVAWQTPPIGAAEVRLCINTKNFNDTCASGQFCCPNDNYMTSYSCPTGYTLSGTTCSRSATSGSDDTGYYTQNYGTCDAVGLQLQCCNIQTTATTKCMACVSRG